MSDLSRNSSGSLRSKNNQVVVDIEIKTMQLYYKNYQIHYKFMLPNFIMAALKLLHLFNVFLFRDNFLQ